MNVSNVTSHAFTKQYVEILTNLDQFFLIVFGIMVLFIGAIAYWAFGFAFSYGEPSDAFIGYNHFFSSNVESTNFTYHMVATRYNKHKLGILTTEAEGFSGGAQHAGILSPSYYFAFWFFQFTFAISATTIASGAMAERVEFSSYMVYCFIFTGYVYPVVAHWAWSANGWLKSGIGTGLSYQDFAGSGVVHLTGGTTALVGAIMLGPRIGRFNEDGTVNYYPGHSVTVTALGGYILFIGFMAFNGGSEMTIVGPESGLTIATAVMNTIIGGSAAAVAAMLVFKLIDYVKNQKHYWSLLMAINGGLAGMVSLCATCNDLHPWAAFIIGAISGASLIGWHYLVLYLRIDDPLDAVAVHFGGGLCGVLLGPIFATKGLEVDGHYVGGVIHGGSLWAFKNWGWSLLAVISIIIWTSLNVAIIFGCMRFVGKLRVNEETENQGSDTMKHNEPAYPRVSYSENLPLLATNSSTVSNNN